MVVAEEMKVSQRHVQRLWVEYLRTRSAHIRYQVGQPKGADPSYVGVEVVLGALATSRTGGS